MKMTSELVTTGGGQMTYSLPPKEEWELMREQASVLIRSGLMPKGIKTAEQVIAIMLKGRELNVPTWTALTKIHVIQGVPTVAPELMLALIRRSGLLEYFVIVESTDKVCTIKAKRVGEPEHTESFTFAEASRLTTQENGKTIPLTEKYNWRQQPAVMLRWRCISKWGRIYYGDVISGLYTPEEINPDIRISDEGDIIDYMPDEWEAVGFPLEKVAEPVEPEDTRHWTERQDWVTFWTYTRNVLGLTKDEVHEALEVPHAKEFTGSKLEAFALLDEAAKFKAEAAADVEQEPLFGPPGVPPND
jgi:hypothetical protein